MERNNSQLLSRISHFVPCNSIVNSETTKCELVISSIYNSQKKSLSIDEIINNLKNNLGCEMHESELKQILMLLEKNKFVYWSIDRAMLMPEIKNSIRVQIDKDEKIQDEVISEWLDEDITPTYQISDTDKIILSSNLILFIKSLFLRHGVESINLIVNFDQLAFESFDIKSIINSLPPVNSNIYDIECIEFPKFLSSEKQKQGQYLLRLADKAFRYLTTVVDPDVLQNFKKQIKNKTIYLDSSVVYRLVNLQGKNRHESIKELVDICKEFDLNIKISAKTLEELNRRLTYDANVLLKYPVPQNLAAVGIKYMTQENYVSTYWYDASKSGISVHDFIDYYRHIDDILENMGIIVERVMPNFDDSFNDEVKYFTSKIFSFIDPEGQYMKSDEAAGHDAYNLAMVKRYRGIVNHYIDSNTWFLTTDHTIIRMQKQDYDFKSEVPIAIMPTQLIQILRFISPTNSNYDESFLSFFSSTATFTSTLVSNESVQEILARISKYRGTPSLANKVLSDSYFTRKYNECTSEGEKDELVHDTLISKAKDMEENIKELNDKIKSTENEKDDIAVRLHDIETMLITTLQENAITKDELSNTRQLLDDTDQKSKKYIKFINKLLTVIALILLSAIIVIILIIAFGWTLKSFSPIIEKGLTIILFLILSFLSNKLFGKKTGKAIGDILEKTLFNENDDSKNK